MPTNKSTSKSLNENISVDCVVFGFDGTELHVLLIDREDEIKNVASDYALPGNLIYDNEDLKYFTGCGYQKMITKDTINAIDKSEKFLLKQRKCWLCFKPLLEESRLIVKLNCC